MQRVLAVLRVFGFVRNILRKLRFEAFTISRPFERPRREHLIIALRLLAKAPNLTTDDMAVLENIRYSLSILYDPLLPHPKPALDLAWLTFDVALHSDAEVS